MSDRRLLNRDPLFNVVEYFIADDDGGFTIETHQTNIDAVLDRNRADLNDASGGWGDGKLVARIPMEVYVDWKAKGWMDDQKKLKALLDDPDNAFMRTWPGRLS